MADENTGIANQADDTSLQNDAVNADQRADEALGRMAISDEDEDVSTQAESEGEASDVEESESDADADEDEDADDEDSEDDAEEEEAEPTDKAKAGSRAERRIHKLTAQRDEIREKLESTSTRVKELEGLVDAQIALPRDYVSDAELKQIQQGNMVLEREEFLLGHVGTGFEDPSDDSKSLTAQQVAQELVAIRRRMPEVQRALALYEERKRQADEDRKVGRTLRLSKVALKKTEKPKPTVRTAAPPASSPGPKASPKRGVDMDRFHKAGATDDAAARELMELIPG